MSYQLRWCVLSEGLEAPTSLLPLLVLVHGESFEWGSSAALDGSALAAHANIAVVTLNYRLGILGQSNINIFLFHV